MSADNATIIFSHLADNAVRHQAKTLRIRASRSADTVSVAVTNDGEPIAANAYLGGFGIARCLLAGADVVVTGRVTDASLTVGPAAAHFGWAADDFDALAGAMAAGHVIECGAQATGGNYSFFTEIADLRHPGFPIAEIHPDGSSVITKHPGTGGAVTMSPPLTSWTRYPAWFRKSSRRSCARCATTASRWVLPKGAMPRH